MWEEYFDSAYFIYDYSKKWIILLWSNDERVFLFIFIDFFSLFFSVSFVL